jgi:aminoglycoside phosphotransferase family enzyme/predicted kinase
VIAFLADPRTHGGYVVKVDRLETHGAHVFLAGERAYKIKRAVKYPFMDFSTLKKRRKACERELELNRRTAPDLYLGVRTIRRGADGRLSFGDAGEIVEYAVEMRRFPQDELFDRIATRGGLDAGLLEELVAEVARLHGTAESYGPDSGCGGAEGIRRILEGNLDGLADAADIFSAEAIDDLRAAATAEFETCAETLDARRRQGRVRQCHGDLHLRNIVRIGGKPVLFDCIEFSDEFARIDVFYDLAFLLMDLVRRRLTGAANQVLNAYLGMTGDFGGLKPLRLFLSLRAMVRAKVAALAAVSVDRDSAREEALAEDAQAYFRLAREFLLTPQPLLLAIGGRSGTGKSTVARALAPELAGPLGAVLLRSDVVRKRLFGVPPSVPLPERMYDREATAEVYAELRRLAGIALRAGLPAIVDAVHAIPAEREAVAQVAQESGARFAGIWLDAPEARLIERVGERVGDASDADADVVRRQMGYDLGGVDWEKVDADQPLAGVLAAARRTITGG